MQARYLKAIPALALAIPLLAQAESTRPRIEIPNMAHDFGVIFHAETYVHAYEVFNRGTADLIISEVNPSCGCTAVKFDRVIPPGGRGTVELSIEGSKVEGQFDKTAGVVSNDPDHPTLTLRIAGHEIPYVAVDPEGTIALHGRSGEPVEQKLTIASNEKDLDFKVLRVTSNIDDKLTYALDAGTEPGLYSLTLYKNPKLPTLSTYGTLTLFTNSEKSPTTTVQVHVMTKGSITMSPSMLNFGSVRFAEQPGTETTATKAITLTRAGGAFKIKDVTVSNPNYKAVVDAVTPGQQYRVQVTFTPPARTKQLKQTESGEMIIHTDDPQEPAVRVQLLARAK